MYFWKTKCGRKLMRLTLYFNYLNLFLYIGFITKVVSLGSCKVVEALFPLSVAELKGFNWYHLYFYFLGFALLDVFNSTKMMLFQVFFILCNKSQGLISGE
uniref:Uncharacterized protein n=1 Tax=Homalodisca liturata TaxID=320908 RepID=A0A1B6JF68_9HEMI